MTRDGPSASSPDVMTGAWCDPADALNAPCTTAAGERPGRRGRRQGARSRHTGGVNAALCDGSVRCVRNSIDIRTGQALGAARGGEVVGDCWPPGGRGAGGRSYPPARTRS